MKFEAYTILGGHPGMTQEELKQLHRLGSQKHHPDRIGGGDEKAFTELQAAWRLVKTSEARSLLRTQLQGLGDPCAACSGRGYLMLQKKFTTVTRKACVKCGASGFIKR